MIRAIQAITLATTLAFVTGNLAAARTLEMPDEGVYELMLGDVIMPRSLAGTAIVRPCERCESVGLRVSSRTRYLIRDRQLELKAFREAVEEIRLGNGTAAVGVFYDRDTKRVTQISVFPLAR